MSNHIPKSKWITAVALAIFHAGAVAALFYFTWTGLWVTLALLWISGGWGIGMGYHRLLTHRSYSVPKPLERFLAICGALALQGGPLFWVGAHRLHHQTADRPGDPHSPRDGWWWAHAGWLVGPGASEADLARLVPDLRRERFYVLLQRFHFVPTVAVGVILALWDPRLVLWGIFLRTVVEWHGTWLVNSAAHRWGGRRFDTADDSTNNWWVALISFGEGWHNNHHADPLSARHGLARSELDVNWLCISTLARLGLARDVRLHRRSKLEAQPRPEASRRR